MSRTNRAVDRIQIGLGIALLPRVLLNKNVTSHY